MSNTPHWATPKDFYEKLDKEFEFDFDPCPLNADFDGLSCEWGGVTFVNPPYGRGIGLWLKKGVEEWKKGKTIVFLIPSRTDTAWWHDFVMQATEIRYIRGRLKFGGSKNSAPFPSAVAVYRKAGILPSPK
jgi:site-specific DNA-methyltransferase (adenine-specific)